MQLSFQASDFLLTCIRSERQKITVKKVCLNYESNPQPPCHKSDTNQTMIVCEKKWCCEDSIVIVNIDLLNGIRIFNRKNYFMWGYQYSGTLSLYLSLGHLYWIL